jgi:hypothetical protein
MRRSLVLLAISLVVAPALAGSASDPEVLGYRRRSKQVAAGTA